jgi:2-amino-4-hydroxy-6-hydroxymethyldihydropteridine diphosphokinase
VRRAYLSLGSNVGDRVAHLRTGVTAVSAGDKHRVSSVFETTPISDVPQGDYLNLVLELTTDAAIRELLARARHAEEAAGRERTVRFGPRTLDVDVLLVGDEVSDDPEVTVPHPRMGARRFVLAPLRELAPELVPDDAWARAEGEVRAVGTLHSLR